MKIPTFLTTTAFKVTSGVVLTSSLVGGGVFIANNQTKVQSDTAVEREEFNSFVAQQNQADNTQNQRIDSIASSSYTSIIPKSTSPKTIIQNQPGIVIQNAPVAKSTQSLFLSSSSSYQSSLPDKEVFKTENQRGKYEDFIGAYSN